MSQGLILEGVHFGYDGAPILDNIHLHVPPGQFVSLLGASGSGSGAMPFQPRQTALDHREA